ncbi:hypothetical protein M1105_07860 [Limibaculum sp. FT325]|uniref:hypothetical protein n=1 Tax=Thermohalobaculum sediminis TaxID=2939436 RepID=UPI0020BF7548|nr:hypothetical protein [Limibaculum sediminis]MCL5776898.1 hypothetical protein [Limibaculum sediminis]
MRFQLRLLVLAALVSSPAAAEDPTRRATRLEPMTIDAADGFSIRSYKAESGTYYRWRIESDGRDEYKLLAPGLFRESWIDQVVIEEREVKPMGLHAIEFDDAGAIDIYFVPIRPGRYEFFVEGLETQGFRGEFVVE